MIPEKLPHEYVQDLERAVNYLKSEGCNEIYLFGSLADGSYDLSSDIDLAVRGIDPTRFFAVYGKLLLQLKHSLDLVDLDIQPAFGKKLQESGSMIRVN